MMYGQHHCVIMIISDDHAYTLLQSPTVYRTCSSDSQELHTLNGHQGVVSNAEHAIATDHIHMV